jgi:hypothetical protein
VFWQVSKVEMVLKNSRNCYLNAFILYRADLEIVAFDSRQLFENLNNRYNRLWSHGV